MLLLLLVDLSITNTTSLNDDNDGDLPPTNNQFACCHPAAKLVEQNYQYNCIKYNWITEQWKKLAECCW